MSSSNTKRPRKKAKASKSGTTKAPAAKGLRWVSVSHEEASSGLGRYTEGLAARQQASQVNMAHLRLTTQQRSDIALLYSVNDAPFDQIFDASEASQATAERLLLAHDLTRASLEAIDSRWSKRWGDGKDGLADRLQRALYQCDCGYNHEIRNVKTRQNAFDFTGCLAHVQITFRDSDDAKATTVLRVQGYLQHNEACQHAVLARMPRLPLHPSVYALAVQQLNQGLLPAEVRRRNLALHEKRMYPGQPKTDAELATSPYRWLIKSDDTRALYRQQSSVSGVSVRSQPHLNVHHWLDPSHSDYNATLAAAIFHYEARSATSERLQICIATEDMRAAAWRYGHGSQIMLDGTFGLCDKRLLLFIAMGVDEEKKGVPLAFFLFSAPAGNRQTSAGYNTDILEILLTSWRDALKLADGRTFTPLVGITDTDLIERAALLRVFPRIWLLLCRFHLRQSWRNHRNKVCKGKTSMHDLVRGRLIRLELRLVETLTLDEARRAVAEEVTWLDELGREYPVMAKKGRAHTDYLLSYWLTEALWASWSAYGRRIAAGILECAVADVLPTTNHLESFNNVLKNRHLPRWQRGGRRMRIDTLLRALVMIILPSIYQQRRLERQEATRLDKLIARVPGGAAVLAQRHVTTPAVVSGPAPFHVAPDVNRDLEARRLLDAGQIGTPTYDQEGSALQFCCYSSLATSLDRNATTYAVRLGLEGGSTCTCPDYLTRGGACKHLRAALLKIDVLRAQGIRIPKISVPTSPTPVADAAAALEDLLASTDHFFEETNTTEATALDEQDNTSGDTDESVALDVSDDEGADRVLSEVFAKDGREAGDLRMSGHAALAGVSAAGLRDQAMKRVLHELRNARLQNLATYLEDVQQIPDADLEDVQEAVEGLTRVLNSLQVKLARHSPTSVPKASVVPAVGVPPVKRGPKDLVDTDILPPSPEKKQKRQQSHAIW